MILDYTDIGELELRYVGGKVFLDGREIKQVWYVDTEQGIVKTYDVFGENKVHYSREDRDDWPDGTDLTNDAASLTLRGNIILEEPPASGSTEIL